MEVQEINNLKAEIYDLSKTVNVLTNALLDISGILGVSAEDARNLDNIRAAAIKLKENQKIVEKEKAAD